MKDVIATGFLCIRYPSGKQFSFTGDLWMALIPGERYLTPAVSTKGDEETVVLLDPRAIVTLDTISGARVYAPRTKLDLLPAWVTSWLQEHPEWK